MRCGELKKGQILVCGECGFELQVVKECGEICTTGACCTGDVMCCGEPMNLKE
ncbi:hypothetical protein [Methanosarcina sp. KYL-1]|uniref:hypothetical protein n=1 Tax=Methanosarcina sp. KYL-1 TaxID=2602068 RepID=UPI002100DDEC|nr:hypothetical protein [Methanosarcina sp. KYL-1]